jgi:anti-sigma factor RsiW
MRIEMEHFSEQPLVDFVRGVSGPELSRDLRAHLAKGCSKCKTAHDAWSRVRRMAAEEGAYAPPENLVRLVKLEFSSRAARRPRKWTLANLVFDSFAQPLPAGVRSGTLNVWQVIYEAEGLTVDLRFGRRSQSKEVHVVGQVFDKQAVRALKNNATVELATEKDQLVAAATLTDLGEFHLEFEAKEHLWLSVKAAGRNTVRIPLANPA